MPVALAIDIGTSSVRASLWDENGLQVGAMVQRSTSPMPNGDGAVEFDADELLGVVEAAIDQVLEGAGPAACGIVAVGTSCFWHSLVGIDEAGDAATTVTTWADSQSLVTAARLRASNDEAAYHRRTGSMLHSSYPAVRIAWYAEHVAEARRVATWMSFADFVRLRFLDASETSVSMASGSGLFDPNASDWDDETLSMIGVSRGQLPTLSLQAASGLVEPYAKRWPAIGRVPWMPVVGDGACATIGSGCVGPDRAALTLGTSGALRIVVESPHVDIPEGLFAYRIDARRWVIGGALSEGGGVMRWLCAMLGLTPGGDLDRQLDAQEPDGHGLTVLPFATGERSPGWNDDARFTVSGMTAGTRPVAIVRAALESVAFRFQLIAERLREIAPGAKDIVGSGGALRAFPSWCRILADVLGRRLFVPDSAEASSRGAALLALEASGDLGSLDDVPGLCGRFVQPDDSVSDTYRSAAIRQQKLYDAIIS